MREAYSGSPMDLGPARASNVGLDLLSYGKFNPKFMEAKSLAQNLRQEGKGLEKIAEAIRAKFPDRIR